MPRNAGLQMRCPTVPEHLNGPQYWNSLAGRSSRAKETKEKQVTHLRIFVRQNGANALLCESLW